METGYSKSFYTKILAIARAAAYLLYPPKVEGIENLPAEGGCIICPNHISMRDAVIMAAISKRHLRFMGKAELFDTKFKWFTKFLHKLGAFPVARGDADLSAIRTSLNVLKEGNCLLIFGQGTRRKKTDTEEPPMNTGVALLALRSKTPVIPVYIKPPYRIFRRMHVYIGKPMDFTDIKRADKQTMQDVTDKITGAIFSMGAPAIDAPKGN